jgi:hypothetical protein
MVARRKIADRCGSCRDFKEDFADEDKGVFYGHCGVKPRTAAITDETYKCAQYRPLPELSAAAASQPVVRESISSAPREERPAPVSEAPASTMELGMMRDDLRRMMREVVTEVMGLTPVPMADKFKGGKVIIQPRNKDLQSKEIPIDDFFHKIVMLRDRLRVLEQKVNASGSLDDQEKVDLQQYVTRCYGSLTTFNVLFRDDRDRFVGDSKK